MPGRFYIAPNSIIALLRDIPIDQAQEHTLWFANGEDQANYFYNKQAITLTQQYYVRQGKGVIKVEARADQIYDCNYMMYKNVGFGNKWFYAFITSIEYTNNNTATITFVIDQMQTWFIGNPDALLGQCFVEREHSITDVPGDNLVPENLETGEFVYSRDTTINSLLDLSVVVATTSMLDTSGTGFVDVSGFALTGMYSGVAYYSRPFDANNPNNIADINNFLELITNKGKSDAVVSVFMAPTVLVEAGPNHAYDTWKLPNGYTYYQRPTSFDGYVPRNNKLLTAPYCCIMVKTPTNAAEYAWEYFSNPNAPNFEISGNCSTSPAMMLMPNNYKTTFNDNPSGKNYLESLTVSGFPQCAYTIDTYKAWLAQNGASLIVNGALATAGLALSVGRAVATNGLSEFAGTPGLTREWTPPWEGESMNRNTNFGASAGVVGSLGGIFNLLAQVYQHSILPPHAMGNADGSIMLANRLMNFLFFTKTIRVEFAQIIDQFFDKFGYATHQVKIPNIHVRRYWTYTKTIDCIIHGNIPTEAVNEIQNIFNRGVTFWADPSNVGNYSLRNYPLEVP